MYGGTVVETGPVAQVLAAPRHPYTAALIACELEEEAQEGRLRSIPGDVPSPLAPMTACIFAPRCTLRVEACLTGVPALRQVAPLQRAACIRAR
jgi:oligopeptide/dipeptide ABC transporter ATP-binding protein